MKKAVFFDIDGTILDCLNGITDMTARVKRSIHELQKKGKYKRISTQF